MSLFINTNINTLLAQKNLSKSNNSLYKNMTALSTGLRINSASDDAAGVGIASRLSALKQSLMQSKPLAQTCTFLYTSLYNWTTIS